MAAAARVAARAGQHAPLLLYPLLLFLSFPHPIAGGVLDLGWLLAWTVPAALLAGLGERAPRSAARAAFLAGWVAHAAILHWIYVVTVVYGHAPPVVGVVAPIGLALYPAVHVAAVGAGHAYLQRHGLANPWTAAALWTALDQARSFTLTGFPWAVLGYAQHENPGLLGLAAWTGVHGLSFVTVLASAAGLELWRARRAHRPVRLVTWSALAAALGLCAVGLISRPDPELGAAPRLRIAVLQGNIEQGVKWSAEWSSRTLDVYEGLARRAADDGARLIVWPETAVPGAVERDPDLQARLARLARATGAVHVVGGVGLEEVDAAADGRWRFYDSAFVFDPDGRLLDRYDKSHLVPFGEYVPFRGLLGHLLGAVARGIASADVSAGAAPRAVALPLGLEGPARSVLAGVPICYELLFPDGVRRFAVDGAGVLLAITNDAWYGRTGAPYQFLAITALRAAENGLWLARAANTGVSAIVDAAGRVRQQTPIFEEGLLVADVPIRTAGAADATFYTRTGEWLGGLCWLAGIGAIAWIRYRGGLQS